MSGGGGAPAVQAQYSYSSPFQNPAYNAVAMGTKQSPGPIARSIQIGNQLAQNWQDSYTGAHPGAYYGVTDAQATPQFLANQRVQQGAWSPPNSQTASGVNQFDPNLNRTIAAANPNLPQQTAKQGGIMSLGNFDGGRSSNDEAVNPQGYAKGGPAKPKYNAKSSADDKLSALQTAIDGGYTPKPAETRFMQGMADSAAVRQQLGSNVPYSINPTTGQIQPAARGANQSTADYKSYLGQLDAAGAALDPKTVKQYGVQTGAATQQQNRTSGVNAPYSMQQAVEQRTAYFDPVTGQSTNPLFNQAVGEIQQAQQLPGQFGQATQAYNQALSGLAGLGNYTPQQVQASQLDRGNIRDVSAQQARVERMRGGPNVQAIESQANQMAQPADVAGQSYQAANIASTPREQAQQFEGQGYNASLMSPVAREQGVTTAAPKSWTDPGVAQQYMNPYAQAVINQNVDEANRNFMRNLSGLRGQAAKSKAYGGSRQGLEEAEALRNQGYLLADIQDKGMSQAYQQGMGQFQAEQGLGSQVGMSNTAQINQLKSQYMQMGMTEAQANQAAQNAAAQFSAGQMQSANQANAQMVNQLKSQYMSMGLTEAQANQAAQNAASQFGAQSAQQAAVANQQAGLTTGQANLSAAQQTALANQQAGMTAQQLNQLYGQGGFQTQAANQAAQNQAYSNYVAQMLAAQQGNQQVDYNTLLQNAQLAQQAATANQQAGLQANQQNIGAYNAMLSGAQGLGALGASQAQTNLANIGALGQAAQAQQNLGQQYLTGVQQSAQNYFNWPQQQLSAPINAINQLPSSGGATTQTQRPASALGWKKGGLMNLRKARRA